MNTIEMTRLCAEAMGITGDGFAFRSFNPLHDDAQAMALVKKFDMVIEREKDKTFGVTLFGNERKGGHPVFVVRNQADLNRAIVECVAKSASVDRTSKAKP